MAGNIDARISSISGESKGKGQATEAESLMLSVRLDRSVILFSVAGNRS